MRRDLKLSIDITSTTFSSSSDIPTPTSKASSTSASTPGPWSMQSPYLYSSVATHVARCIWSASLRCCCATSVGQSRCNNSWLRRAPQLLSWSSSSSFCTLRATILDTMLWRTVSNALVYCGEGYWLWTAYLVELFPFAQRAKGITIFQFFGRGAGFFTTFVNPIGLKNIAWKWLITYCCWLAFEIVFIVWLPLFLSITHFLTYLVLHIPWNLWSHSRRTGILVWR